MKTYDITTKRAPEIIEIFDAACVRLVHLISLCRRYPRFYEANPGALPSFERRHSAVLKDLRALKRFHKENPAASVDATQRALIALGIPRTDEELMPRIAKINRECDEALRR